jgi:arginyl-tRNA synthetase
MSNSGTNMSPKEQLQQALAQALASAREKGLLQYENLPEILIQRPSEAAFGDYSTNLAMAMAREAKMAPRKVAEIVLGELQLPEDLAEKPEIAGAGFINFRLKPAALQATVHQIAAQGKDFGRSTVGQSKRILLEYVSANPTGPIGVVQGRAGAIGDVLGNLLCWTGYHVEREYYVNDAANSTQVQKFSESVEVWYLRKLGKETALPEDGYQGEYVSQMADEIIAEAGPRYLDMAPEERHKAFYHIALERIIAGHRADLEAYGLHFDHWSWESKLYESGEVARVVQQLQATGQTYESEGAVWLKTSAFGHGQDEVLVRKNQLPTYLAADIAYHRLKFERGYDILIDIWGPDHHGHVSRMKAAMSIIGWDPNRLHIFLHQYVRLLSGGEMVRMSKRAGDIVLLRDLINEVGADVTRFFFLMRSADSHVDFDLELAKKHSSDNPVYYVQYAHARICSIFRSAEEQGLQTQIDGADLALLVHPREFDLMRKLADFPEEIELAAAQYEPHRMTRYAMELAATLHLFYTDCRVLSDDLALTQARLALLRATQTVLQSTLGILGISAPEKM